MPIRITRIEVSVAVRVGRFIALAGKPCREVYIIDGKRVRMFRTGQSRIEVSAYSGSIHNPGDVEVLMVFQRVESSEDEAAVAQRCYEAERMYCLAIDYCRDTCEIPVCPRYLPPGSNNGIFQLGIGRRPR